MLSFFIYTTVSSLPALQNKYFLLCQREETFQIFFFDLPILSSSLSFFLSLSLKKTLLSLGTVGEPSPLQGIVGTVLASLITTDKSMAGFRKLGPRIPAQPSLGAVGGFPGA